MTNIAFPSLSRHAVAFLRWALLAPVQEFRSALDGVLQTGETQGPRWVAVLSFRPMNESDAVEIQAFKAKLRGKANRALVPYPSRSVPRGTITLAGVTTNGSLALGASQVSFDGAGASKTLLTGDFFSMGGEFKMVVDGPYTSDGAGAMLNIKFEPPLRAALSSGGAVTLNGPTCRMVQKSEESGWGVEPGKITRNEDMTLEEDLSS